ncbi:hypothetical protein DPMN_108603 [Dreissena polymorpha]|uniref:Uncharacterized protein n=1 Tax=Dreissena polymorpha TaxID=45954 RepID=A0A9D4K956_DREPO|nr:hypothetical protein DPMN_108603 [Dreissena polymorpha]
MPQYVCDPTKIDTVIVVSEEESFSTSGERRSLAIEVAVLRQEAGCERDLSSVTVTPPSPDGKATPSLGTVNQNVSIEGDT